MPVEVTTQRVRELLLFVGEIEVHALLLTVRESSAR
jgi:hypothetical protein